MHVSFNVWKETADDTEKKFVKIAHNIHDVIVNNCYSVATEYWQNMFETPFSSYNLV